VSDAERGKPAEQTHDQCDSAEELAGDHKKGHSRGKVQVFGERAHAARKTGSAIPSQQFLSAVREENESQHDPNNRDHPINVCTRQNLYHRSLPLHHGRIECECSDFAA
jgi:hypothetical protein